VLAVAALAAVPVAMGLTHSLGFLEVDLSSFRLTRLPGDVRETSLWGWLVDEFITPKVWATVLPVLLVLPAGWLVLRRRTGMASRASLAVALGPVFVAIGFACRQLSWWNQADADLLALLVAATAAIGEAFSHRLTRWVWLGFVAPMLVLGAIQIIPPADAGMKNALDESEIFGLIERDLARWLAIHAGAGRAVILAPHNETITLHYYGGLRGLATLGWENRNGLEASSSRRGIPISTFMRAWGWASLRVRFLRRGMTGICHLGSGRCPINFRPLPDLKDSRWQFLK
jgi:hypothetical protein